MLNFRRRPLPVLARHDIEAAIGRLPATRIPKVIHRIWLGSRRPPLELMESCRQANPGWVYALWNEDNLPPLCNRDVFDSFGSAHHGKADVARYELLHRFGGVYVDADVLSLRSFDDLLGPDDAFFASYQNLENPTC